MALFAAVLLAATGCGGGDDNSITLTVVPQLDELPAEITEAAALEEIAAILERRAEILNGTAVAEVTADGTVRVEVTDIAEDQATDLLGTAARLEIVGPRLEAGQLICVAPDGTETTVAPADVTYPLIGSTRLPRCPLSDGSLGAIAWDKEEDPTFEKINGDMVNSVALSSGEGPTVTVTLTQTGAASLAVLSFRSTGLPLGILIEGQLIGGPTVSAQIPDGRIVIAGIILRDARILRAQLLAGEMPVPITLADAGG